MSERDVLRRLERREGYLRQDPHNAELLADAFDTALQEAEWERAEFHLRHGLAVAHDRPSWLLREAHWFLGQHRWTEASRRLLELQRKTPLMGMRTDTVTSDLAYLDLHQGEFAAGISRLEPVMDGKLANDIVDPLIEILGPRLLHWDLQPERAMKWLEHMEQAGGLRPKTAGVTSLIALDEGNYAAALRWANSALGTPSPPIEAHVAHASLALGERDAPLARKLLRAALARNRDDGMACLRSVSRNCWRRIYRLRGWRSRERSSYCLGKSAHCTVSVGPPWASAILKPHLRRSARRSFSTGISRKAVAASPWCGRCRATPRAPEALSRSRSAWIARASLRNTPTRY